MKHYFSIDIITNMIVTERYRRACKSHCIPVLSSVVNGCIQKAKLVEEFHSGVSTKALCPQIGHLFGGRLSTLGLGNLPKTFVN